MAERRKRRTIVLIKSEVELALAANSWVVIRAARDLDVTSMTLTRFIKENNLIDPHPTEHRGGSKKRSPEELKCSRDEIMEALKKSGGIGRQAVKLLPIHYTTLAKRIRQDPELKKLIERIKANPENYSPKAIKPGPVAGTKPQVKAEPVKRCEPTTWICKAIKAIKVYRGDWDRVLAALNFKNIGSLHEKARYFKEKKNDPRLWNEIYKWRHREDKAVLEPEDDQYGTGHGLKKINTWGSEDFV